MAELTDWLHNSANDDDAMLNAKAALVLTEYKRIVRFNGTERAVAYDKDGFMGVQGEIIETAERMGFSFPDDEANQPLWERLITRVVDWQHELRAGFERES